MIKRWRAQAEREQAAAAVLLVLWVALPMLVFCLSRSRLPMYILPLFVPLAMLIARQRMAEGAGLPATSKVVTWAVLLLTLKIATAYWPTHKNAEAWADAIRERMPKATKEVVFVEDMARYGLNLHLDAEIEKVSLQPTARAQINPEFDGDLATELRDADSRTLFIAKLERMPEISQRIEDIGYSVVRLGAPFNSRALFVVRRHVDVLRGRIFAGRSKMPWIELRDGKVVPTLAAAQRTRRLVDILTAKHVLGQVTPRLAERHAGAIE